MYRRKSFKVQANAFTIEFVVAWFLPWSFLFRVINIYKGGQIPRRRRRIVVFFLFFFFPLLSRWMALILPFEVDRVRSIFDLSSKRFLSLSLPLSLLPHTKLVESFRNFISYFSTSKQVKIVAKIKFSKSWDPIEEWKYLNAVEAYCWYKLRILERSVTPTPLLFPSLPPSLDDELPSWRDGWVEVSLGLGIVISCRADR